MDVAKWTTNDESVFINIMAEHVRKGDRATTTFTAKAWNEIVQEFKEHTGNELKKDKFWNKFNKLRIIYRNFKKLRNQPTGFRWDPDSKTVTATEDVWENYLKTNPHARQFKNKGCKNFDELDLIYDDTTATGLGARAFTQVPLDDDDDLLDLRRETQLPHEIDEGRHNHRTRSRTPTSHRRKTGHSVMQNVRG